jgi:hypothetical protein
MHTPLVDRRTNKQHGPISTTEHPAAAADASVLQGATWLWSHSVLSGLGVRDRSTAADTSNRRWRIVSIESHMLRVSPFALCGDHGTFRAVQGQAGIRMNKAGTHGTRTIWRARFQQSSRNKRGLTSRTHKTLRSLPFSLCRISSFSCSCARRVTAPPRLPSCAAPPLSPRTPSFPLSAEAPAPSSSLFSRSARASACATIDTPTRLPRLLHLLHILVSLSDLSWGLTTNNSSCAMNGLSEGLAI